MRKLMLLALVVLLLGFAAVPATAGSKGTNRPFKADLVGGVTFEFGTDDHIVRCGQVPPGPLVLTDSWGNATHMGGVQATWVQCAIGATGGFINQEVTMVAANGDQIVFSNDDNSAGDNPYSVDILRGTGRFDGASGSAEVSFVVEPLFLPPEVCEPGTDPNNPLCFDLVTPWPWSGSFEGMISY